MFVYQHLTYAYLHKNIRCKNENVCQRTPMYSKFGPSADCRKAFLADVNASLISCKFSILVTQRAVFFWSYGSSINILKRIVLSASSSLENKMILFQNLKGLLSYANIQKFRASVEKYLENDKSATWNGIDYHHCRQSDARVIEALLKWFTCKRTN